MRLVGPLGGVVSAPADAVVNVWFVEVEVWVATLVETTS